MKHVAEGEWYLEQPDTVALLDAVSLFRYAKHKKLPVLELNCHEIAHKGFEAIDENSQRFKLADVQYPLLVSEGLHNPLNKKYRMLDGRHRLKKLLQSGITHVNAYVIPKDIVMQFCNYVTKK